MDQDAAFRVRSVVGKRDRHSGFQREAHPRAYPNERARPRLAHQCEGQCQNGDDDETQNEEVAGTVAVVFLIWTHGEGPSNSPALTGDS